MFEVMSTWIRSIKDGREAISKSEHMVLTAPQKGVTQGQSAQHTMDCPLVQAFIYSHITVSALTHAYIMATR